MVASGVDYLLSTLNLYDARCPRPLIVTDLCRFSVLASVQDENSVLSLTVVMFKCGNAMPCVRHVSPTSE